VDFATEVITGNAFAVIDQKLKIAEDVLKNTTATAQLGSGILAPSVT
jgi:hypothetical protein